MTTAESKIINVFKKKDFLPNLIEFFTQKTTYFLTSRINSAINSNIEVVLCFKNFSEKHVLSESLSKNNKAKFNRKEILTIDEIEDSLRYTLEENYKCLSILDELIDCLRRNEKKDECDFYDRFRHRENYNWERPPLDDHENRVIVDHLGLYVFSNGHRNTGKIILFCDKIIEESIDKSVDLISLFKVVLIHELAHAFHHLGIDSKDKTNILFGEFDQNICEGFANYMVRLYINERHKTNDSEANLMSYAFEYATSQEQAYGVYKSWIDLGYSIKAINATNNDYRDLIHHGGGIKHHDFKKSIEWYKTTKNY